MTNPYRKSVRHLDEIDIYQIGNLYEVKSHAVFHALKKLLCAGKRGAKDYEQDLMEAIESIERELQMVELNAGHLPDGEGWIEWKKGSSINSDEYPFVEVKLANGHSRAGKPGSFEWYVRGGPDDIVAYRKAADFDEQRIDVIGQNGNEGEHYEPAMSLDEVFKAALPEELVKDFVTEEKADWRNKVDWSRSSPHHVFAYKTPTGGYGFAMHEPLKGEYIRRPAAQ